ncbi:MAG: tRNA lysidine(34) synthetase TilS [Vicinamibacteria bacterium]
MKGTFLSTAVRKAIEGLGAPSAGQTVVVGLSGGADSVALTDALASLGSVRGFKIVAAHLDHGLRPESPDDAAFCRALSQRLGVPIRTSVADVRGRAKRDRCGLEDAARVERYAFLESARREQGAAIIAVAHTRDDQAETFLMRLLRGSGSTGLSAMRPRNGFIVRPLLEVSRDQVLDHLRRRGLPWREDPTNRDLSPLRNRVRHELLPYLESRFNPRLRAALSRTAGLLGDEADVMVALGDGLFSRAIVDGDGPVLSLSALRAAPRAVARLAVRRALASTGGLKGISGLHVDKILSVASSKDPSSRRLPLPGHREVVFSFRELRFSPRPGSARQERVHLVPSTQEARA